MNFYPIHKVQKDLAQNHYSFLEGSAMTLPSFLENSCNNLIGEWEFLKPDNDLKFVDPVFKTNEHMIYRHRRWGQYLYDPVYSNLNPLPYNPFTQYQVASNIEREVFPWLPRIYKNQFLLELIRFDYETYKPFLPKEKKYTVNVHLIRVIDGSPSPEGIHQDDVYLFSVRLIQLQNSSGGESEIYDNNRAFLAKISMQNKFDTYFVYDNYILHKGNPIVRILADQPAIRDVLIISFQNEIDL